MSKFVFPFVKRRLEDGSYAREAKIPVTLIGKDASFDNMAYLDSGSTISYLPLEIAEILGFDREKAAKTTAKGIAGEEDVAHFSIDIKIAKKNQAANLTKMPVLVFLNPETKFTIIGLEPFFQGFDICFKLSENKIEIKEKQTG